MSGGKAETIAPRWINQNFEKYNALRAGAWDLETRVNCGEGSVQNH